MGDTRYSSSVPTTFGRDCRQSRRNEPFTSKASPETNKAGWKVTTHYSRPGIKRTRCGENDILPAFNMTEELSHSK